MVAGGTGYIGGGVLEALHQQGFWLRALCRDPSRLRDPAHCNDIFLGHATHPETLTGLYQGIDVVFSSLGTRSFRRKPTIWEVDYQSNLNLLDVAKREGVKHFIVVSVVRGAEMARLSPIAQAREQMAQALKESGLDYTGRMLSKLANGDCACLFQYEREVEQAVTYSQSEIGACHHAN